MYFDNPTLMNDDDNRQLDTDGGYITDPGAVDGVTVQQTQTRAPLHPRAILHYAYHIALIVFFAIVLFSANISFISAENILQLFVFVVVLGIVSTVVKSDADDKVIDPTEYIPSPSWRFVAFGFFLIGELLILYVIRDMSALTTVTGVVLISMLAGVINLALLWLFADEEFDDYKDIYPAKRTVNANFAVVTLIAFFLLIKPASMEELQPVASVLSLFYLAFYGGFFWSYVIFDRESIQMVERIVVSFIASLLILPLTLLLLNWLGMVISPLSIILVNYVICALGFFAFHYRPIYRRWVYSG